MQNYRACKELKVGEKETVMSQSMQDREISSLHYFFEAAHCRLSLVSVYHVLNPPETKIEMIEMKDMNPNVNKQTEKSHLVSVKKSQYIILQIIHKKQHLYADKVVSMLSITYFFMWRF